MNYEGERQSAKQKDNLPFLVWLVAISTMVACIGGVRFLGYNIAGYAWVVPLTGSIIVFLKDPGSIRFPIKIWLPWICLVLLYLFLAEVGGAIQRSIMLLCPIFIGMTVSKMKIRDNELERFRILYRRMAVALYVVVVLKTGIHLTGRLPSITGLAPEVMTGTLLCSLFATNYVFGKRRDLAWWAALSAIPVIAVTRTGMVAAGLSLPLTFAPMKIVKRAAIIVLFVVIGLFLFQTERIQRKMFYSGSGTTEDVRFDNPNFATHGRSEIWKRMRYEIKEKPWFGHGANAAGVFIFKLTGGLTHPHNDWLRLEYDYGYIGAFIFGLCVALQMFHALKRGRRTSGETRILFLAGAAAFLVFALFMFTDNIILYAAFFGNFHFTVLGLAYAADSGARSHKEPGISPEQSGLPRIRW